MKDIHSKSQSRDFPIIHRSFNGSIFSFAKLFIGHTGFEYQPYNNDEIRGSVLQMITYLLHFLCDIPFCDVYGMFIRHLNHSNTHVTSDTEGDEKS